MSEAAQGPPYFDCKRPHMRDERPCGECTPCLRRALAERDGELEKLRDALEWCARQTWEGCDVDGGDFHDEMVERGLLVEVPADEAFREEWDSDTMWTLPWIAEKLTEGVGDE